MEWAQPLRCREEVSLKRNCDAEERHAIDFRDCLDFDSSQLLNGVTPFGIVLHSRVDLVVDKIEAWLPKMETRAST
jgi:hypothetical protein